MPRMTDKIADMLEFPCRYPLKVMGHNEAEFINLAMEIIQMHCPGDYSPTTSTSRTGKYVSLTVHIHLKEPEQLERVYQQLSSHPKVKTIL
ncbi:MAG: hypothetical protein CMF25_07685 [Kangiellaceae bacterium]|nr:hypothetical protein [Kangiellaceae bacterium]